MKLKMSFIAFLITAGLFSCSYPDENKSQEFYKDSTRKADSIASELEKQRIIDSINIITEEQQIIADSIQNQVN